MVTKSLTNARVPLVYAAIFALTFLVALWWRSPAGDAHSPVVSGSAHAIASAPLHSQDAIAITAPITAATVPALATETRQPTVQPVVAASLDEPRDTIAGDSYPLVHDYPAIAPEAAAATALLPAVSAAYALPAEHPDHGARDFIPGD